MGLRFTLFSFGRPSQALLDAVATAGDLLDCWEIAHNFAQLPAIASAAAATAQQAGIALYLSKLRSKDEMERGGEKYYHMINHGFALGDAEQLQELAKLDGVTGAVFRVAGEMPPWATAHAIADCCASMGLHASLHIRMSRGHPGSHQEDEAWVTERALQALSAAAAHRGISAYLDAFADIDRGYFPRQGVVDRLYNPRPAFHALRHLNAALAEGAPYTAKVDAPGITLVSANGVDHIVFSGAGDAGPSGNAGVRIDLRSGEIVHVDGTGDGDAVPAPSTAPYLWVASS